MPVFKIIYVIQHFMKLHRGVKDTLETDKIR